MFEQIKRLGTDTAIYGVSTVVARLLNFVLVPLYTNLLTPAEFGVMANIYSYIAFIIVFYSFGMESAYFRFATSKEIGSEKDNFSTPYLSILSMSLLLSLSIALFAVPLTSIFQITESSYTLLYYTAGILFFDAIVMVPFASLRLQRKSKYFASAKVINIVITIILNIVTVYYLRWGLEGIFLSNLAASAVTFMMMFPVTIRQFQFSFNEQLFSGLLKFGVPLIPVAVSGVLLQVVDRPILKYLMDDAAVGIYQANFRLGIFMALVNGMFEFAWRPFYLSHDNDPNAKQIFSRVMTYYLCGTLSVFLILSFFLPHIIQYKIFGRYIIPPDYWSGLSVVPFVLLGYIFSGIGTNLNAGIQIQKKTFYLLPTSFAGSITKIILTFLLVPLFGISGAAYATILGYAVLALSLYFIVQRIYYIEYEFLRIAKLIMTVAVAFSLAKTIDADIAVKLVILAAWFVSLFVVGFFTKGELLRLGQVFRKNS